VSYADAGVGVIMSVNNSLASWPILRFGTEEQKQKYLVPLARGDKLGCYALTEPGAGSDAGAQKTRITKDGDHYVLNGTKMWITNGPQADVCVAYASLDPEQRHRAVCAFVLERDMPGYRVGKLEEKLGIHCSSTSEILFEDLRVPQANLLHKEGEGFKVAMATLDRSRLGVASQALGIAQGATDYAAAYAKEREQFGKPIASFQGIQFKLADMETRTAAARELVYRAAAKIEAGDADMGKHSAMAKLFASDTAMWVTTEAVQVLGGYGYVNEYPVERMMRDAKITQIYEGTNEIQRLVIARTL
jgi:butyryl-CoA dehydrogenase